MAEEGIVTKTAGVLQVVNISICKTLSLPCVLFQAHNLSIQSLRQEDQEREASWDTE